MRTSMLVLAALVASALTGCTSAGTQNGIAQALPSLPANPDPSKRYCKVWVPAKTRMVPKLVQTCGSSMKSEPVTVMQTSAREVMVKGPVEHPVDPCCQTCTDTLVQAKPGGYRWECDGGCWQYKYRPAEYKWCSKTVQEDKVRFCYTHPAEYETVVETRPVTRCRKTYVPPQYDVKYVEEVYEAGYWEWRATEKCGPTTDCRDWSGKHVYESECGGCPRPSPALDCSCPRSN
ncbi:MAG: hypothetical protein O2894_12725 [Planctomycetota bacterium]|nr:hypothetical protein [Planctomycetota bacterium]